MSLSSKEEENYNSNTADDDTDPDQVNNENPIPSCNNFVL